MRIKDERRTGLVRVRGGFSDTSGIAPRNTIVQLEEFDDDTRTKLSNCLFRVLEEVFEHPGQYFRSFNSEDLSNNFCKDMLNDVFCKRNTLQRGYSYEWRAMFESVHEVISQASFNEVLDVIEYSCRWIEYYLQYHKGTIYTCFNQLFEREYVGYRFVNGRIVAISDKNEIDSIEEACGTPFDGCRIQLQKALAFLSDRDKKDYKNSIKESISAVESICQIIVNNEKASLGDALKQLEKSGLVIHPSLKSAFMKLYGYSSDKGGIRHAEGMFESEVSFEEAKFMLVSCSAFINYIISEMGKRKV